MTAKYEKESEGNASLGFDALERLKSDTHLAILSVFCAAASLAIAPFAVYRLIQGHLFVALTDGALVVVMLGGLAYAWNTGRSVVVGNVLSTILAAGALLLIPGVGLSYMWMFSLMIAIFLLADARVSIVLSLVLIGVTGSASDLFDDRIERLTFFAVAAQVALFSFVFAWRTSRQHRQLDVMANRDPLTGVHCVAKSPRASKPPGSAASRPAWQLSTWITSRTSTIVSDTTRATRCWSTWPRSSTTRCASPTASTATAARSSSS